MPRQRPNVTVPEAVEWKRLYQQERKSSNDSAKLADRNPSVVRAHLLRQGVHLRKPHVTNKVHHARLPHAEVERRIALYESGLSARDVAKIVGRTEESVRRSLIAAGVMRSKSEAASIGNHKWHGSWHGMEMWRRQHGPR